MRAGDEASSAVGDCGALAGDEKADAVVAAEGVGVGSRRPGVMHYIVSVEDLCKCLVSAASGEERGKGPKGCVRALAPPLTLKTTVLFSCGLAMLCCSSRPT